MSPRGKPCDSAHAAARLAIAQQFVEAAEALEDSGISPPSGYRPNVQISNYVQAGIAAADAICCAELKEHSVGDNHADAIFLLKQVKSGGTTLAKHLGTLLGMKTNAAYGAGPMNDRDAIRAQRAAEHLVAAARDRLL